jgi:predicted nucleotide-binding protein
MFIGLLGRDRVAALNDPSIELPTDFSGVAYIPVDGESWQIELARELKAADIAVSLDKVL